MGLYTAAERPYEQVTCLLSLSPTTGATIAPTIAAVCPTTLTSAGPTAVPTAQPPGLLCLPSMYL